MRAREPPALFMLLIKAISPPMISTPSRNPATGEETIGTTTFQYRPLFLLRLSPVFAQTSACQLLSVAASAAPQMPPISAWLDEDGSPRHQVKRFQTMPPASAQMITCEDRMTTLASTSPEEIVLATAVPQNAPIRLVAAAITTACIGVSTLVATTVAMELAVSWKPLMNSNTNAVAMTSRSRVSTAGSSGVLQYDLVHHVAGIAAAVDGFFQQFEQVLEDQVAHRIGFARIGFAIELEDQAVGFGFDRLHLVVEGLAGVDVHALAQQADHLFDHFAGALEHHGARGEIDFAEALGSEHVALGEFLDDLRNLVQGARQRIDVFAFKRGDEGVDQLLADLRGQGLFALACQLELLQRALRWWRGQQFDQRAGAFAGGGGAGFQQPVKLVALAENGLERKHRAALWVPPEHPAHVS